MWCSISFDCRTQSNSIHGLSSIFERSIDYAGRYRINKNYPVSVEGAFDCDSFNVDFKGGNEMIC